MLYLKQGASNPGDRHRNVKAWSAAGPTEVSRCLGLVLGNNGEPENRGKFTMDYHGLSLQRCISRALKSQPGVPLRNSAQKSKKTSARSGRTSGSGCRVSGLMNLFARLSSLGNGLGTGRRESHSNFRLCSLSLFYSPAGSTIDVFL